MQRALKMGGRKIHTERDFEAEQATLVAEFEEQKLKHASRISQIMEDTTLSTEEKKMELRYEKALLTEEQIAFQTSLQQIYDAKAEQYEGNIAAFQESDTGGAYCEIANEATSDNVMLSNTVDGGIDY